MADILLQPFTVHVTFLDGSIAEARAEGNNAAWMCKCDDKIPLLGRCYFAFGYDCHTICACGRRYRVFKDEDKRTEHVEEY